MDLDALRAQGTGLVAQFERFREGFGSLRENILNVRVTEKSADGLVAATVGPQGQLVKLELDPRIYRRPNTRELAGVITKTIQEARRKALAEVAELCGPYMPEEQFQAHMNYDFEGIMEHFEQRLPKVEETEFDARRDEGGKS